MPFLIVAPAAVTATPMGMDKSANQVIGPDTTTPRRLEGWVPRSGYGDTVVNGNHEMIIGSTGADVLRCRIQLAQAWQPQATGALRVSLMQNTVEIKAAEVVNGASSLTLADTPVTVQPGDRIWVAVTNTTSGFWAINGTIQGGNTTYVTFDAAQPEGGTAHGLER
ncbi:hypothetical protein [Nocardia crassostreae]|uniref:hypothetical protein n=1 Tax=Nocardia crassostreae TaxID=53428 RepID=UPI00083733F6|nr:hypothetical protein [Nocardia crassostreae]